MRLLNKIKSWFKPQSTKKASWLPPHTPLAPSSSQEKEKPTSSNRKAANKELIATLSNGRDEVEISIPDDHEFQQRGWKLGNWFNQQTLATAFSIQQGVDASRQVLQKVAYEITRPSHPEAQKQWFREHMTQFVRLDPVYQSTIDRVRAAIRQTPGLLQSEIYKGRNESEKEAARYILYFAHELGDIRREKSGRSYKLYLPDESEEGKAAHMQMGETQNLAGGAISSRVMVRQPSGREQKIRDLHKQATVAAKEKDYAGAVTHLEEVQSLMEMEQGYQVERYLRRPNYLQQAGRISEAEAIFQKLLALWPQGYDQEAIHNQMRIAYNREKDYHRACLHGVQGILWRCTSYAEQERLPVEWQAAEFWSSDITKLLKRAKRPELLDVVLERLAPFFADPRRDAIASTVDAIQELLNTDHD